MSFCVAVNCMDGRVQHAVLDFLEQRFGVQYVDMVTEPGPNGILSRQEDEAVIASMLRRIDVSVTKHHAVGIAVVGHYDCTGNPGDRVKQDAETANAVRFLRTRYPRLPVIGLWIDRDGEAEEIRI